MRDPRATAQYQRTRRHYIDMHSPGHPCCLCGRAVDTTLPGNVGPGPTVEHKVAVRDLRAAARDWDHLVELTCDTTSWGLAHLSCQRKQGGTVSAHAINAKRSNRRVDTGQLYW